MSEKNLLEIKDLHVNVEDKEILHGVNLEVGKDEVHVQYAHSLEFIESELKKASFDILEECGELGTDFL